jgi:hypothetical protein
MFGRKKNTGAPPVPSPHFQAARQVRLTELDTTAAQHNLDKADAGGHISLVKNAQAVGEQLQKRGLLGRQAEPWLLIDRSGSMAGHYRSGAVQQLVERALAFALLVSPTGTVNVVGFGSGLTKVVRVTQANYQGVIGRDIPHPGWDTTNLTAALDVVLRRAETADLPIYCVVVADGGADDPATATARFCKSSQYAIFVKLLAVIPVPYFATLDDLDDSRRLLDNIDAKPDQDEHGQRVGKGLLDMDEDEFAFAMVDEWDGWIGLARTAGILI